MKIYYDKGNKRLVYSGENSSLGFWDEHWYKYYRSGNIRTIIEKNKNDRFILGVLRKYIPNKKDRILEGGCGIGSNLYSMFTHGYQTIGVDFAEKTVKSVKSVMPELDIRVGDVRELHFPDNYFRAYWSLGVIEHLGEGYSDILKEMKRVIINGGYVFLTFPYMSPLRRLKARFGLYEGFHNNDKRDFYQFALDKKAVIKDFQTSGFRLLTQRSISGLKGLKDEIDLFKPVLQKIYDYQGKFLFIIALRYILDKVLAFLGTGHMKFLVFEKI